MNEPSCLNDHNFLINRAITNIFIDDLMEIYIKVIVAIFQITTSARLGYNFLHFFNTVLEVNNFVKICDMKPWSKGMAFLCDQIILGLQTEVTFFSI